MVRTVEKTKDVKEPKEKKGPCRFGDINGYFK